MPPLSTAVVVLAIRALFRSRVVATLRLTYGHQVAVPGSVCRLASVWVAEDSTVPLACVTVSPVAMPRVGQSWLKVVAVVVPLTRSTRVRVSKPSWRPVASRRRPP
jgi:hypothetical protein